MPVSWQAPGRPSGRGSAPVASGERSARPRGVGSEERGQQQVRALGPYRPRPASLDLDPSPVWPWFDDGDQPRVPIEHPDPAGQHLLAEALRRRGYDTLTCGGPAAQGESPVSCPLLEHGSCPAVDRVEELLIAGS